MGRGLAAGLAEPPLRLSFLDDFGLFAFCGPALGCWCALVAGGAPFGAVSRDGRVFAHAVQWLPLRVPLFSGVLLPALGPPGVHRPLSRCGLFSGFWSPGFGLPKVLWSAGACVGPDAIFVVLGPTPCGPAGWGPAVRALGGRAPLPSPRFRRAVAAWGTGTCIGPDAGLMFALPLWPWQGRGLAVRALGREWRLPCCFGASAA